jgi:hypothetical protein
MNPCINLGHPFDEFVVGGQRAPRIFCFYGRRYRSKHAQSQMHKAGFYCSSVGLLLAGKLPVAAANR